MLSPQDFDNYMEIIGNFVTKQLLRYEEDDPAESNNITQQAKRQNYIFLCHYIMSFWCDIVMFSDIISFDVEIT